jgi:hypothetical protein
MYMYGRVHSLQTWSGLVHSSYTVYTTVDGYRLESTFIQFQPPTSWAWEFPESRRWLVTTRILTSSTRSQACPQLVLVPPRSSATHQGLSFQRCDSMYVFIIIHISVTNLFPYHSIVILDLDCSVSLWWPQQPHASKLDTRRWWYTGEEILGDLWSRTPTKARDLPLPMDSPLIPNAPRLH